MMKKLSAIFCVVLLVLTCALPVLADEGFTSEYYRLNDQAAILTDAQYDDLLRRLNALSTRELFDIAILIEDTYSDYGYDDIVAFSDDIYDSLGYGYGENRDGVMLVLVMDTRDLYLTTCGDGIDVVTDAGRAYLFDQIKEYFSDGDYYGGFSAFIEWMDDFIAKAKSGEPYDTKNLPRDPFSKGWLLVSLVVGFVLARIIVRSMKAKLKSVRPAQTAASYVRKDSLNDRFRGGKTYIPFSYFAGATPNNDYTPTEPFTITIESNHTTAAEQGYAKLFIPCGGADSPRPIKLRMKGDGKWFLWEQYLLTDIRQPKSSDPWA